MAKKFVVVLRIEVNEGITTDVVERFIDQVLSHAGDSEMNQQGGQRLMEYHEYPQAEEVK